MVVSIMKTFFKVMICFSFLFSNCYGQMAKQTVSQKKIIRDIIVKIGSMEALDIAVLQMIEASKKKHPSIPSSTWKKAYSSLNRVLLEDELVKVWKQRFSLDELKEIQLFVSTKAGLKFMRAYPELNQIMGGVAGLASFRVYEKLNELHPSLFPIDEKTRQLQKTLNRNR